MAQRVTIRRRNPYNTTSNRRRIVKTPGGRLVYHHLKKPGTAPKCGDCGIALPGIPALRPRQYATVSKRIKTVRRAYGGSRCGDCVKSRCASPFPSKLSLLILSVSPSLFYPYLPPYSIRIPLLILFIFDLLDNSRSHTVSSAPSSSRSSRRSSSSS